jgi:hypothetical protein
VLPEVPWNTGDGTSYRALGARAEALLSRITASVAGGLRDPVAVTLLAAQAGELRTVLRDLASSELAVTEIYAAGWRDHGSRPGKRAPLRLALP